MQGCKPRFIPVECDLNNITQLESEITNEELYRKVKGSLS